MGSTSSLNASVIPAKARVVATDKNADDVTAVEWAAGARLTRDGQRVTVAVFAAMALAEARGGLGDGFPRDVGAAILHATRPRVAIRPLCAVARRTVFPSDSVDEEEWRVELAPPAANGETPATVSIKFERIDVHRGGSMLTVTKKDWEGTFDIEEAVLGMPAAIVVSVTTTNLEPRESVHQRLPLRVVEIAGEPADRGMLGGVWLVPRCDFLPDITLPVDEATITVRHAPAAA